MKKLHVMYTYLSKLRKMAGRYTFFGWILGIINLCVAFINLVKYFYKMIRNKDFIMHEYLIGGKKIILLDRGEINNRHILHLLMGKWECLDKYEDYKNGKTLVFMIENITDIFSPKTYSIIHKMQSIILRKRILSRIRKYLSDGLILFDTSDSYKDGIALLIEYGIKTSDIKIYFKREKKIGYNYINKNTIALPHLFPITELKMKQNIQEKPSYTISFGGLMTGNRQGIINKLQKMLGENFNFYALPYNEHLHTLDISKFSLNLHGGGEVCYRFDEIAHSRSLMICQRFTIEMPNNFTDMKNIIYFDTEQELERKIAMIDQDKYISLFREFKKHYNEYYSPDARIKYIEKHIEQLNI